MTLVLLLFSGMEHFDLGYAYSLILSMGGEMVQFWGAYTSLYRIPALLCIVVTISMSTFCVGPPVDSVYSSAKYLRSTTLYCYWIVATYWVDTAAHG